ncbi:isochorismate synthase [Actinokineospora guangxiensis]|uniref:isochorismate synthase n=1 Tax=Actinokineospora guangxiensis TaxID=1490288 RepID=A0ABW0EM16_9PSEU
MDDAPDPAGLVADYRPGDFLLAGPSGTVRAAGAAAVVADPDPDELAGRVAKLLADTGAPLAAGALPFRPDAAPHVVIPDTAVRAGRVRSGRAGRSGLVPVARRPVPAGAAYAEAVATAVRTLRDGSGLRKVVLARALDLDFAAPIDVPALLPGLVAANPNGYTFAVGLPGATLLGATPELLLSRRGRVVAANPLAGTRPRSADPGLDRAAAAGLLASAKDRAEHRVVVDAVAEALRPFCAALTVPAEPELVETPTVWHLSTAITGTVADPEVSSLRLASALHPTPAVCGTPTDSALSVIGGLEPFDRGFYSGAVGWCDAAGDGEWVVAIRCAEAAGARMRLFAGAGIMPASDPAAELAETTAKFATLLGAFGIDPE